MNMSHGSKVTVHGFSGTPCSDEWYQKYKAIKFTSLRELVKCCTHVHGHFSGAKLSITDVTKYRGII